MAAAHLLTDGAFGGRPPDLVHRASGFRIWIVQPIGLLTQVGEVEVADDSVAEFIAGEGQALLDARRHGEEKVSYYHDWRRLRGYSPAARRIMTDWGLRVRPNTDRIVLALSPQAKVVRMGVSVATLMLQLAGMRVEVVDELQPTLDRLGVRPA